MEKKALRITDTTLRDGHQSLWATRMRTKDIIDIIDVIDQVGYYSLEVWGGATFDVCLRFLRENPWERLRQIKARAKKTPLQMLLRGQNIVGYKNYPDDLLDRFIETAHHNGIDIFRVFDALNDTRNLEAAIKSVKKHGAHAQGVLSYTTSPVHTVEKYVKYAKEQVQMGIDSICIKDMAGILSPVRSQELVSALRKEMDIPIQIHCHATSGMAETAYLDGVRAGAGAIDCAVASMAGFSSQPPVQTMHAIFSETEYEVNLDVDAIRQVDKYFARLTPTRSKGRGYEPPIDAEILIHQIPGGMISNFRSQLEQQDALDKLEEALEEVSKVREDLGFPPLVTPTSQIVGTQAVMNVLSGERYKLVPQEVKNYVKGMYGRSPAPIKPEFIKKILGDEKPIDHRPADDLKSVLPNAAKSISQPELIHDEEDILSWCLFPEIAMEFFKWRALPDGERPKSPADIEIEELEVKNTIPAKDAPKAKTGQQMPDQMLHADDYAGINSILDKASSLQLSELVIRKGDFNLSLLSGNGSASAITQKVSLPEPVASAASDKFAVEQPRTAAPPQIIETPGATGETIKAVMAGTYYKAANENSEPFVKPGDTVKSGQTICILEAMKLYNEIQAPFACKIINILLENGAKVKKGDPIMTIEKL
ncbi:MAG: pyruvate carboxylase subunit B [Bacteroidetes bacterium]|nr:MAG: pyruvate carboxylase subunit B [Bacteroidota bacterium]